MNNPAEFTRGSNGVLINDLYAIIPIFFPDFLIFGSPKTLSILASVVIFPYVIVIVVKY